MHTLPFTFTTIAHFAQRFVHEQYFLAISLGSFNISVALQSVTWLMNSLPRTCPLCQDCNKCDIRGGALWFGTSNFVSSPTSQTYKTNKQHQYRWSWLNHGKSNSKQYTLVPWMSEIGCSKWNKWSRKRATLALNSQYLLFDSNMLKVTYIMYNSLIHWLQPGFAFWNSMFVSLSFSWTWRQPEDLPTTGPLSRGFHSVPWSHLERTWFQGGYDLGY